MGGILELIGAGVVIWWGYRLYNGYRLAKARAHLRNSLLACPQVEPSRAAFHAQLLVEAQKTGVITYDEAMRCFERLNQDPECAKAVTAYASSLKK